MLWSGPLYHDGHSLSPIEVTEQIDTDNIYIPIIHTVYAWSGAAATKCFILLKEEATIQERPLFKSGVY